MVRTSTDTTHPCHANQLKRYRSWPYAHLESAIDDILAFRNQCNENLCMPNCIKDLLRCRHSISIRFCLSIYRSVVTHTCVYLYNCHVYPS
ncbi:hypothetical protein Mapa_000776 [Marchantia paleacea]|nr:hypothetical protein Mapa_000776 [Marchantia paleacea]